MKDNSRQLLWTIFQPFISRIFVTIVVYQIPEIRTTVFILPFRTSSVSNTGERSGLARIHWQEIAKSSRYCRFRRKIISGDSGPIGFLSNDPNSPTIPRPAAEISALRCG